MTSIDETKKLELLYTLFLRRCAVRGREQTFIQWVCLQNIMVQQLPVSLIKFAVINHWQGEVLISRKCEY